MYKQVVASNFSMSENRSLLFRTRRWIIFFTVLLVLSGITAFPVQTELHFIMRFQEMLPDFMRWWLFNVTDAVDHMAANTPYLLYGYDWLAYSHLVIALFFYGAWKNPEQNLWVIHVGMIACAGVFVLAFVCGSIRGIPWFWTAIDCSFGAFGILPLIRVHQLVRRMQRIHEGNEYLD